MKTIRYIIFFLTISLVTSFCQRQKSIKKEFYDNGNIKLEYLPQERGGLTKVLEYDVNGKVSSITYENKNGNLDSIGEYYNGDGILLSTVSFQNGKKTGITKWYYPDGKIEEEVYLIDGKRMGQHKYFSRDGGVKQLNLYKIINGESIFNGVIRYDEEGEIIRDSSEFEEIVLVRDTITLGEKIEFGFKIYNQKDVLTRAFIGIFDKDFNLIDSTSIQPLSITGSNLILPQKIGKDTLRIVFETKKQKGNKILMGKSFLEKTYCVIPPVRRRLR